MEVQSKIQNVDFIENSGLEEDTQAWRALTVWLRDPWGFPADEWPSSSKRVRLSSS